MAINTRRPPARAGAAKAAPVEEAPESGVSNVTVSRKFTIPGDGEYESQSVQITVSAPTYEEASALVTEYMTTEFERSTEQFRQFVAASEEVADALGSEDVADESDGTEGAEDTGEDAQIGPDDIRAMKRAELEATNEENGLGLDPDDYPKNKKGNSEFAEAIIEAAGLEAADEGDAETADEGDDADAETGEDETGEDAAEEGVSEEDIRAMSRSECIRFVKDNQLPIATKSYPKLPDLQDVIIETITPEDDAEAETGDGEEETGDGEEETGEDETGDGDDDAPAGYKRSELEGLKIAELKLIYKEWGIKDKFPSGSDPIAKKSAINRIMRFQDTGK